MMTRMFLVLTSMLLTFGGFAQTSTWNQHANIPLERIHQVSMDNQGFIFVANLEGNISQFDRDGNFQNIFSPSRQGRLSQLEASWTVNIFTFSTDLQEYRILDRFLNPITENKIQQDNIFLAKAATLGNNNIIWVFDESDFSLKQLDYRRNLVIQQQPLNLVLKNSDLEIIEIKEYQNMVFLNIKNEGVYIFDNQANFIRSLPIVLDLKLSFWKNNLVFISKGEIILMNFQSGIQEKIPLPANSNSKNILVNPNSVLLFDPGQISIYKKEDTPLRNK
ncbi:hypothetical protein P872_25125 [Rhodonellum psychrophilum GCM71 = DSM 17998]|uniref:Uncharacterized protein n=2 Tax=Rhodonellum TaxID=336827 RepID=U5C682_9BACT|nr:MULTISPECIES: hypothetical protein [Rhodonellum]ERM84441.1 hypothetical protein P872_25125 [Rhodonellum psychrophilum GCM71 = DSM 17998]SDZ00219.1 hypothetical protein SAMN05444412_104257 [Rhodonellum ikkaensis]